MIALITGGSGCGKSTYAEKLLATLPENRRYYVATMQVSDDECAERVRRHRAQRAHLGCTTIERPNGLRADDVPEGATVLLEDLPNWLANEMFGGGDPTRIVPVLRALGERCANLIVVTNDVFSDGGDYDDATRAYMRTLAGIDRAAAEIADAVIEVVYAIPIAVKGALLCV